MKQFMESPTGLERGNYSGRRPGGSFWVTGYQQNKNMNFEDTSL